MPYDPDKNIHMIKCKLCKCHFHSLGNSLVETCLIKNVFKHIFFFHHDITNYAEVVWDKLGHISFLKYYLVCSILPIAKCVIYEEIDMLLLPFDLFPFTHRLSHCGGVYCYNLIGHMTSFYSLEIFLRTKERVFRLDFVFFSG